MSTFDYCIVLCTAPYADAGKIATMLISSGLAACGSHLPVRTHYLWEGAMVEDDEELLIIKTVSTRFKSILHMLKEIHSYELPEFIALPLMDGDLSYITWLKEQTKHVYSMG